MNFLFGVLCVSPLVVYAGLISNDMRILNCDMSGRHFCKWLVDDIADNWEFRPPTANYPHWSAHLLSNFSTINNGIIFTSKQSCFLYDSYMINATGLTDEELSEARQNPVWTLQTHNINPVVQNNFFIGGWKIFGISDTGLANFRAVPQPCTDFAPVDNV